MYDIALSVAACARSGTRADVAWMVSPTVSDAALAFTPGGGKLGAIAEGAFDGFLADVAARQLTDGRLVRHQVTEVESAVSGIPGGTEAVFLVVPASQFPVDMWGALLQREPVIVTASLDGDHVATVSVLAGDSARADGRVRAGEIAIEVTPEQVTTVIVPVRRLVIAGRGPIADAVAAQGRLLGWKVAQDARPEAIAGYTATLSPLDAVVVMGHDVESSSRCLMSALESDAGYIGALGSMSMQQQRADWLAYRDVTDLSRIHGPAGLDIGADTPGGIAVSIAAEVLAVFAEKIS